MRWLISIALGLPVDFIRQCTLLIGARDTVRASIKQDEKFVCTERKSPNAGQDSIKGHPNVKRAADFTLLRKVGCPFFVLYRLTRCRGPPPSEFQKFRWKRRKVHVAAQR